MRDLYSIKYNILKLHSIIKGRALFTVGYTIFGSKSYSYEIRKSVTISILLN